MPKGLLWFDYDGFFENTRFARRRSLLVLSWTRREDRQTLININNLFAKLFSYSLGVLGFWGLGVLDF